jgi:hypothetical protein
VGGLTRRSTSSVTARRRASSSRPNHGRHDVPAFRRPRASSARTHSAKKAAAPTSTATPMARRSTSPTPRARADSLKKSEKESPDGATPSQQAPPAGHAKNSASTTSTHAPAPTRTADTPDSQPPRSHQETRRQQHSTLERMPLTMRR